jgi:hypothetical protein
MMATDTTNLSRKGLLRVLVAQNDALLAGQGDLKSQLTSLQEIFLMALNKNEQDVVDAVNASTNKVATAITVGTQAIADLFKNQSSITLADVQPKLDALNSAADALTQLATQDDPAINPAAAPVVVTNPDGSTTPVSDTPLPPDQVPVP